MEDSKVHLDVQRVFKEIEDAKSISELETILKPFEGFQLNENDYPPINFKISSEEVLQLGSFIQENSIIKQNEFLNDNPIAKILYAVVWKRGDLKKIKHIIKGIKSIDDKSESVEALTFNQFGKFLADKENKEPIVDQHTIRAFACYSEPTKIESWRKISLLKGDEHKRLILKYKEWLQKLNSELMKQSNYIHHVDKILFALGKSIKKNRKDQIIF